MPSMLQPTSTTVDARWIEAFDRYADVLDEHRRQLALMTNPAVAALDELTLPVFVPPADLPPLPAHLVDRALELDRAGRELLDELTELGHRTRPSTGSNTVRLATPTGSTLLDRRM